MKNAQSTADYDVVGTTEGASLQVDEIKKRSIHGALSFVARTVFLTGLAIIAQIVLSTLLGPSEFGMYGIVVTIGGFFTIISDVGLAASLIQKKEAPTIRELRTVFTTQQILSWIVFFLLFITARSMLSVGKLTQEGFYLALAFGFTFPIVSFKTISAILLERKLQFTGLVVAAIAESLVFNALLIYLAFNGYGVNSYTYAVLTKAVVGVIVILLYQRWSFGFAFSKKDFLILMKVGGGFQLNDMLAKAKDDLFYLSLAFFISPTQYGYLTWAKQWSKLPYTLTVDNISAITFPAFSRMQHDERLLKRAIEKTIFFVTIISFPLLGGIAVMIAPLITVFPRWEKWLPAVFSLALFCFSLAFSSFSTPLVSTLNAIGKIKETLKMMVFWTVAQWALAPVFLSLFGYQAVPIISAILALSSLFVVVLVKKYVKFAFVEQIWRQTLATGVMIAILWFTSSIWGQSFIHLLLGVIVGGAIYAMLLIGVGFEKIRMEVSSFLKKK